jgi:enoyl-CoA hydratase/carnithine racemase
MGERVGYELADGVATVTLDDGKVNALSSETLDELFGALDQAAYLGLSVEGPYKPDHYRY